MILRKEHLDYLVKFKDTPLIKVVTGIRRCGKSTLFLQYIDYLKNSGVKDNNIISINFEDLDYEHLLDYKKLYDYILDKIIDNEKYYIFLDEIQNVKAYEKAVDSLLIKGNCDIYITGSNAYLLSTELSTLLSGRYIEIKMLPLSFKEYALFYKDNNNYDDLFNRYLNSSSFPYAINLENNVMLFNYLEDIYNSVIVKDISFRMGQIDLTLLDRISKFIFDSVGSLLSINNISNKLTSSGRKTDNKTVAKYIKSLTDSMLFYKVERYNIKGKNILSSTEKYYAVDIGLRNIKIGRKFTDLGHIIENIVFLELLRRKYNVYVGMLPKGEIDFVAIKNGDISYFQVALTLHNEEVMEREAKSLKSIKDNYPKYIITLDKIWVDTNIDGIKVVNLIDWLLERKTYIY